VNPTAKQSPIDYHMHSRFSEDGRDSPEAMCRRAIELGIPEIGFSEHWDVGPYEQHPRYFQPQAWFEELTRLRSLFAGQLTVRLGIEASEPHLYPDETAQMLARLPFDYVIGSVHFVGPDFMFDEAYFRSHTADQVYPRYFAELEKLVERADLDVVAHFDIPVRTAKPILGYEPARYEGRIRGILEKVIARGLALDVNTAGLRKPARNLMPDPRILQWYAEMGGQRVTLGSDAHMVDQVGLNLEKAVQALQAAGIRQVTRYQRRLAELLPLP
jgi:histidinol-phosphatase (PHP family)